MPTYEYRCNACQREFEIQQKMADPDLVHCDACGEDKLEKLISWTSVRSNSFQDALLTAKNPRDAFKGNNAVDRSRPPKKETPGTTEPAPATNDAAITDADTTGAATTDAVTTASATAPPPATATSAAGATAATAPAPGTDEDDDTPRT